MGSRQCRLLKQNKTTKNVPVVLLTMRGKEKLVREAYASGCMSSWPGLSTNRSLQMCVTTATTTNACRRPKNGITKLIRMGFCSCCRKPVTPVPEDDDSFPTNPSPSCRASHGKSRIVKLEAVLAFDHIPGERCRVADFGND